MFTVFGPANKNCIVALTSCYTLQTAYKQVHINTCLKILKVVVQGELFLLYILFAVIVFRQAFLIYRSVAQAAVLACFYSTLAKAAL